jgi:hypothetical protein
LDQCDEAPGGTSPHNEFEYERIFNYLRRFNTVRPERMTLGSISTPHATGVFQMNKLAIVLAVGAAALLGGSAANAADNSVKAKAASDVAHQSTDFSSRGRHYRHYGHRGYRPYYGNSYGYAPRPYYGSGYGGGYGRPYYGGGYGYGGPSISFGFGGGRGYY